MNEYEKSMSCSCFLVQNACRQRGGSLASITNSKVYEYALSLVDDGYIWVKGSHEVKYTIPSPQSTLI